MMAGIVPDASGELGMITTKWRRRFGIKRRPRSASELTRETEETLRRSGGL
jgi:hypothetical protein